MKRVKYRVMFAVATMAVLFPCALHAGSNPNIVLILADDLGIGDISAYNDDSRIRTPNLDAMCANGIRFTDANSSSSVGTPSRYGLLTGRYAFRKNLKSGAFNGFSAPLIDRDRSTLATMLRKEGYNTACIGKWHLGWKWTYGAVPDGESITKAEIDYSKPIIDGPTTRGFDYFYGIAASLDMPPYVYVENDMPTALPEMETEEQKSLLLQRKGPMGADFKMEEVLPNLWERTLGYIEAQKDSVKPFFLYVPLTAPHKPILPTDEYQGKSKLSPYGDFVLMVDDMLGEIIAKLKATGQYENTIVIFASDNGCAPYAGMVDMDKKGHSPNDNYPAAKSDLYHNGHRVPLIVAWGNRYDGLTESGLISLTDFYATFAEMSGYALPDNEAEDSYSVWPVLTGQGKSHRADVVLHTKDGDFVLLSGHWKLIVSAGSGGLGHSSKGAPKIAELPTVQLFDMVQDPAQTTNLGDVHPEVVAKLKARMRKYIEDGRSTPGQRQPNDATGHVWKQIEPLMP